MYESTQIDQWLYISTVTPDNPVDLDAILTVSRRNNSAAQLTGLLMFNGKRFLQVLEGPHAAVAATYARIGADTRHRAPVLLARKTVAAREFGDWSMGFKDHLAPSDSNLYETIVTKIGGANPNLRAELMAFARQIAA